MRLFLAVALPEDVRRHAADVQERLRPRLGKASLPRAGNLHVTLKFLGDVPDSDVAKLCNALGGVPRGGAVSLQADHVACFPPRGRFRVVTLGLRGEIERLRTAYADIEQACFACGYPKDGRRYTPHITLARARVPLPPAARGALEERAKPELPGPTWAAKEFVLMESRLDPRGAIYTPLARFGLV